MLKLALLAVALLAAPPVRAQQDLEAAARRSLIEREQQSELFALRLRQLQQNLKAGPVNGPALDALQLEQRQREEVMDQEAQRSISGIPGYERARAESDRAALQLRFSLQTPAWGPQLQARHWTPTLE